MRRAYGLVAKHFQSDQSEVSSKVSAYVPEVWVAYHSPVAEKILGKAFSTCARTCLSVQVLRRP